MPPGRFAPVPRLDKIVRSLCLITSPACRGANSVPLSAIAGHDWPARLALCKVLWTGRVSADMAELLSPIVRAFETASSGSPRGPNHWKIET
jgi:hypothetical protein